MATAILKVYSPWPDPDGVGQGLIQQAQEMLPCAGIVEEGTAEREGYGFVAQGRPWADQPDYMRIWVRTCPELLAQIVEQPGFELVEMIDETPVEDVIPETIE